MNHQEITPEDCFHMVGLYGSIAAAAERAEMPYSTFRYRYNLYGEGSFVKDGPSRVLVIGDTHCPVMLPEYVEFLQETYDRYDCNRVVHIGDVVDWAAISYHRTPLTPSTPEEEYHAAKEQVSRLRDAFPTVQVTLGNHGALPWRRAEEVGLFPDLLKDPAEMWDTPGWEWRPRYDDLEIDGVIYRHGDKALGGNHAAFRNAKAEFRSVVQGHLHAQLGVWYHANTSSRVFGMQTGCGVDHTSAAMSYGLVYSAKPLIGCGVVLEGQEAIAVPMLRGSRFQ
jgi:hypothetical protein